MVLLDRVRRIGSVGLPGALKTGSRCCLARLHPGSDEFQPHARLERFADLHDGRGLSPMQSESAQWLSFKYVANAVSLHQDTGERQCKRLAAESVFRKDPRMQLTAFRIFKYRNKKIKNP
jgi:hypothetical protein